MARIRLATVPVIGHIAPMLPLCRALSARGHEVAWYTGTTHRSQVEAAGARFFGYQHAREYDDSRLDEELPQRGKLTLRLEAVVSLAVGAINDVRGVA